MALLAFILEYALKIIAYNPNEEEIVKWKNEKTIAKLSKRY